jgi:hypothetical protein
MTVYEKFFKAYYEDHKEFLLKFYDGSLKLTEQNYYDTVLQRTALKNSDFENFERKIKLEFPQEYKDFFLTAYSYDRHFQLPGLTLATAWYEKPFEGLNDLLFKQEYSKEMITQRLIPVGLYYDNFYVCLDLRHNAKQVDTPITYFDLDNAIWGKKPVLDENVYPSFTHFIEHYTNCILTGTF